MKRKFVSVKFNFVLIMGKQRNEEDSLNLSLDPAKEDC